MNSYLKLVLVNVAITFTSIGVAWLLNRAVRIRPKKLPETVLILQPRPEPKTELCDFKSLCEHK